MTHDHLDRMQSLLLRLRALPPDERRALLDSECGEDPRVRAELEQRLSPLDGAAAPRMDETQSPAQLLVEKAAPSHDNAPIPSRAFPVIDGYDILREIHRGGQGVVYQAVQKATKRKVAVKLLLEGRYASKSALRRFQREIELVARFKHANIVSVFDSGMTTDDLPYCVMDYVRGVPLHQYARDNKLPLEAVLRLFSTVCEAVNHAHQKGVIHRDLKPSNVLVDAEGVPKVLDFGLAKQLAGPDESLVSLTGQVVGTLPYMSPEQAEGNPDKIDTRTDVYALGVILYEMLTGQYPYPVAGQMAEVLRHIAHTPPTPPTRGWKKDSGVTQRQARRVREGECPIDDEVQTIVLRTLSKERDRRYQSAGELTKDIGCYLAGEPIEAKRDSGWYLLKKNIRKYRVQTSVAAAFLGLLLGFGLWMSVLYQRAEHARKTAEREKYLALNADLIASGYLLQAQLQEVIGRTFATVGRPEAALAHLCSATEYRIRQLGDEHRDVAASLALQAALLMDLGRYTEAERDLRKAREIMEKWVTKGSPRELWTMARIVPCGWPESSVNYMSIDYSVGRCLVMASKRKLPIETRSARFQEAERLLQSQHDRLSVNPTVPRINIERSFRTLIKLYENWHIAEPRCGHDKKAAQWRDKFTSWQTRIQQGAGRSAS